MIVDIVILAVIAVTVLIGRFKGLLLCLIDIGVLVASMILAFALCQPLASLISNNTEIDENISNTVNNTLKIDNIDLSAGNAENLPKPIADYVTKANGSINETKDNIKNDLSKNITSKVINGISYIIIFFGIRIVAFVLKIIARIVNKLPGIKEVNHLGGAICGFVQGVFVVYITFAMISLIAPLIQNTPIISEINKSYVGKAMYNNNILIQFFNK